MVNLTLFQIWPPICLSLNIYMLYIYIYIYIVESNFKANSVSSSGKKSETKGKVFHYFIIIESNDKKQFYGMSRPITQIKIRKGIVPTTSQICKAHLLNYRNDFFFQRSLKGEISIFENKQEALITSSLKYFVGNGRSYKRRMSLVSFHDSIILLMVPYFLNLSH